MRALETKHSLDFEVAEWSPLPGFPIAGTFMQFRVGTCEGLWTSTDTSYDILAITNSSPGNGHFEDVIQWFEYSCRRDKKDFRVLDVWNKGFRKHLIKKRGFQPQSMDNLIKKYRKIKIVHEKFAK